MNQLYLPYRKIAMIVAVLLFTANAEITEGHKAKGDLGLNRVCHTWGNLAYNIAVLRDRQLTIAQTLMLISESVPMTEHEIRKYMTGLTYAVFASKSVNPQRIKTAFVTACLSP